MSESSAKVITPFPADFPAELNALLGVFLLYWKVDEMFELVEIAPDISKQGRHLLIKLDRPRRMGELAGDMQVLPSTVTALADELERQSMVERRRDPEDRRAWQLCLTDTGRAMRTDLMEGAARVFNEISGLSADETEAMAALMRKVADNIAAKGLPKGFKECS